MPTVIYASLQKRLSHLIEWYIRIYRGWPSLIQLLTWLSRLSDVSIMDPLQMATDSLKKEVGYSGKIRA